VAGGAETGHRLTAKGAEPGRYFVGAATAAFGTTSAARSKLKQIQERLKSREVV